MFKQIGNLIGKSIVTIGSEATSLIINTGTSIVNEAKRSDRFSESKTLIAKYKKAQIDKLPIESKENHKLVRHIPVNKKN